MVCPALLDLLESRVYQVHQERRVILDYQGKRVQLVAQAKGVREEKQVRGGQLVNLGQQDLRAVKGRKEREGHLVNLVHLVQMELWALEVWQERRVIRECQASRVLLVDKGKEEIVDLRVIWVQLDFQVPRENQGHQEPRENVVVRARMENLEDLEKLDFLENQENQDFQDRQENQALQVSQAYKGCQGMQDPRVTVGFLEAQEEEDL